MRQINGPNGPLLNPELKRTIDGRTVSTTLDATLQFVGGIEAFSDPTLSATIGAAPWAATAEKFGVDPMQSVGVTLVARLPGDIKKSTGTEADGGVIWTAPNDGTAVAVVIGTAESKVDGGFWQILATIFGYILGLWLIIIGILILLVIFARRRRTARSTTRASNRATPDA
jgi:hypothetical protein